MMMLAIDIRTFAPIIMSLSNKHVVSCRVADILVAYVCLRQNIVFGPSFTQN